MYKKTLYYIAIFSFLPLIVMAEKYSSMEALTGKYKIKGKTAIYASSKEPKDTHFSIYLTGNAAKTLYEKMKVKPEKERCEGDVAIQSKYIKDMLCKLTTKENKYECFFAVNIKEQRIEGGWTC